MSELVYTQRLVGIEASGTNVAQNGVGVQVCVAVVCQRVDTAKRFPTVLASERRLSCMNSHVVCQRPPISAGKMALVALERPLVLMNQHVLLNAVVGI